MKTHGLLRLALLPVMFVQIACAGDPGKKEEKKESTSAASNKVKLQLVTDKFISPVNMAVPGDGSNRLFFCQKEGQVWIVQQGKQLTQPFLDVSSDMVKVNAAYDERGLLGMAFHPDFKRNRKFYVYYSAPVANPVKNVLNHKSRLVEFTASAGNPNIADPASKRILLEIDQPESNHNGGQLAFGKDGYLYVALGDGGGAGDKHGAAGNGQNLGTLLGKIIRIDVNGTPYKVPADNPFVKTAGAKPEIWAYGLRNPWRFSFDRVTHQLFTGDVGQDIYEEIDIITKGGNYGWRIMEGYHDFKVPAGTDKSKLIAPIHEYDHNLGISITGGYVYRGKAIPALTGQYVFGDYNGKAFVLAPKGNKWERSDLVFSNRPADNLQILSWGEDEQGELYMLTSASTSAGFKGAVYKLVKD
ncbi:PQQ-dependent sugar dehydrogenase [Chitinophaga nivalis]|uniref:PQQ-dependent sugar dehydrogenase n=1 Tax=Chitinophaga nivalis TaxID=2991709 RepID=A0ABT3IFY0_9BACT|nr:PQQ-dependent sugar dehydrogenase [Chitinophaga nivalis]MCW3467447.1 PQQ-dependent sugar dehydrogenase [Chitinophaga nivalis]MCW3482861.1 PQQ-dependent sugar dehydrogenase [Chitinophaga nivalis]